MGKRLYLFLHTLYNVCGSSDRLHQGPDVLFHALEISFKD